MVYYVFQAQRESGMMAEWNIEAKGDMFIKSKEELAKDVLKTINKANLLFWNKWVSCKFIKTIIK